MPLRIAHVISTPRGIGGAEKVLAALVARGSSEGWEQVVLNPFSSDEVPDLGGVLTGVDYRRRVGSTLTDILRLRRWLKGEITAFGPDLVHVHLFHALVAVASVRLRGMPKVVTHHHGDFFHVHRRRSDEFLDRAMGRRYDSIVAVSDAVRRFLLSHYGYRSEKVVTIRNGWSGEPLPRKDGRDVSTVVCVGNLRVEKGHGVLLRAFARTLADRPARLVLVGDGPLRHQLAAEVSSLGIDAHVSFLGSRDDVWAVLSEADIFAFPSLSEPLGIAVMEAMAAGLPVIASDVGGLPEVVQHGVSGLLVQPGDERSLSDGLGRLLDDPAARAEMGEAGRMAAQDMKMATTIDRYVEHYRRLVRGAR